MWDGGTLRQKDGLLLRQKELGTYTEGCVIREL